MLNIGHSGYRAEHNDCIHLEEIQRMSHYVTYRKSEHVTITEMADLCDDGAHILLSSEFADLCERTAWDEETRAVVVMEFCRKSIAGFKRPRDDKLDTSMNYRETPWERS